MTIRLVKGNKTGGKLMLEESDGRYEPPGWAEPPAPTADASGAGLRHECIVCRHKWVETAAVARCPLCKSETVFVKSWK